MHDQGMPPANPGEGGGTVDEAMAAKIASGTADEVEMIATAAVENAKALLAQAQNSGVEEGALAPVADAVGRADAALQECQQALAAGDEAGCREAASRAVGAAQEAHEAAEMAGVDAGEGAPGGAPGNPGGNPGGAPKPAGPTEAWAKMVSAGKNPY